MNNTTRKLTAALAAMMAILAMGSAADDDGWHAGPSESWFVNWDKALSEARRTNKALFLLHTGSDWCGWCKKLKADVLDQPEFNAFARQNLVLVYLDSPHHNPLGEKQRAHNEQIVKALPFGRGVPHVLVMNANGEKLGAIGGGGQPLDAYLARLREILASRGEKVTDAGAIRLFAGGYQSLPDRREATPERDAPAIPEMPEWGELADKVAPSSNAPLSLDASPLREAYAAAGSMSYKCRAALKDFEKTIAEANANAQTNRSKIAQLVRKHLKSGMDKAQADGDLDRVVVFERALETADGELEGDAEEIAKLRAGRGAQLAKIDQGLVATGVAAAQTFNTALEWQKKETTKKGDFETAQIIAGYQKQVEEWAKATKEMGVRATTHATPEVQRPAAPPRPVVRETKPVEPEAKIVTIDARNSCNYICSAHPGDTLEICYLGGKWSTGSSSIAESPDAFNLVKGEHRCMLVRQDNTMTVIAQIPSGTADSPFRYVVDRDDGSEFALRMNDPFWGNTDRAFGDNTGSIRYSVKIIPGEKSKAEGGRVQTGVADGSWRRPVARQEAALPNAGEPPAPRQQAPASTAAGRILNQTLTGTQTEVSVTLAKTALPHVIREQYVVPQGKELVVEAGATIVFERDASLYCEGALHMNGTEQSPIICKGKMGKAGYWKVITVKSSDSVLENVHISDAECGLRTESGNPNIKNCIFQKCKTGATAEGKPSFYNCSFLNNEENGVWKHGGGGNEALFDHCTFANNGGWGFDGRYSASPAFLNCLFENNKKGGIHVVLYSCRVSAQQCVFINNKGFDVFNESDVSWDFKRNYWGPSVTRLLQQRGDGANLPNIKDGRDTGRGNVVDVAEFLTEPPKDCGATVKW